MNSMMMNAKKKALMALIKKMRGMEADGMSDEEQMKGDLPEGEDSGEEEIEIDPGHDEAEEGMGMLDDMAEDKKSFFKRSNRIPSRNKTRSMAISVEMRSPKSKLMKKLG